MDTALTAALCGAGHCRCAADGAVVLAGLVALRAGAERVQLVTSAEAAPSLAAALRDALVRGFSTTCEGRRHRAGRLGIAPNGVRDADALLIGPGWPTHQPRGP